jgi:hypothetical protein
MAGKRRRTRAQVADGRQFPRLLRTRCERPRRRRAAKQRDKFAALPRFPFFQPPACSIREGNNTSSAPPILTACDGDGVLGCYRVPSDAAKHDLAVAAADADATAACDGANLLLQVAGVNRDLHVEHADQLHALIKH